MNHYLQMRLCVHRIEDKSGNLETYTSKFKILTLKIFSS